MNDLQEKQKLIEIEENGLHYQSFEISEMKEINSSVCLPAEPSEIVLTPEQNDQSLKNHRPMLGVFFILVSILGFMSSSICIKITFKQNPVLTGSDALLIRLSLMLPAIYLQAKILKVNLFQMDRELFKIISLRSVLASVSILFILKSFEYLPISIAVIIYNINPVMVTLLAYPILNEQLTLLKVCCVLGAFIGVTVISYDHNTSNSKSDNQQIIGVILSLLSAAIGAVAYILLKIMNKHSTVHYLYSPFYV